MITLGPVAERETVCAVFRENGLEAGDNAGCVAAKCGEEQIGFCLYTLDQAGMTVLFLSPQDDLMLADGILRSTLHVAAERGILDAFYTDAVAPLCEKLDFIEDRAEKRLAIGKLFQSCRKDN